MIRMGGDVSFRQVPRTHKQVHQDTSPQPLRVFYYNHSGDVSGAEISLLLTISHMQRHVETTLIAPEGELLDRARKQDIRVMPVNSFRARMSKNSLVLMKGALGTWRAGLELRRLIQTSQPDILHANSIRAGLISIIGVLGHNTRLIWHLRDNLPLNMVGRAIRLVATWRVHKLFAISNAIRENFAQSPRLQRKTMVVHNGIDVTPTIAYSSIRSQLRTPPNRFVVAVVGQIALWKRQHDAILAFSLLHRKFRNSELWIVGESKFRDENVSYMGRLRDMAKSLNMADCIRFLGFRSDVMNVMNSIDALLVPSENEPFGRVVIEAMLAGKPVIGTDGGGIPEIVLDKETGYLINVGDTVTMAECLSWLYMDRSRGTQMGASGRNRVLQTFSIQSKVRQMHKAYVELLSKGGPFIEAQTYRVSRQ